MIKFTALDWYILIPVLVLAYFIGWMIGKIIKSIFVKEDNLLL